MRREVMVGPRQGPSALQLYPAGDKRQEHEQLIDLVTVALALLW